MKIYHFPPLSLNRLVREVINGYCLRCLNFPTPLDVDTYQLLTRRASNSKMTELNGGGRERRTQ